jgi:DNA-binding IclR family transcriptional regulator
MKSLHKVLDIIEAVARTGSSGVRELSAFTGFPAPTTHRIVSALVRRGYFRQDPATKKYSLSYRFLELGAKAQEHFSLAAVARPHLEGLMAETRESVNLAVREGDDVVYLDHIRSDHAMLQLFTKPGARVPLYCTGVGKVFLSRCRNKEVKAYLRRAKPVAQTPNTLVKPEAFFEEMKRIREQGFSVDNEEMEGGVRCVAAPVFDHKADVVAAVSISGAAMRITEERLQALAVAVRRCAASISRQLGHPDSLGEGGA